MMTSQGVIPNTEAAILARLVQRREEELSPGAAEYFLSMRFNDDEVARMDHLSELARQGILDHDEQSELDCYIHVGHLLCVLHPKLDGSCKNSRNNAS